LIQNVVNDFAYLVLWAVYRYAPLSGTRKGFTEDLNDRLHFRPQFSDLVPSSAYDDTHKLLGYEDLHLLAAWLTLIRSIIRLSNMVQYCSHSLHNIFLSTSYY
jgi:hypothetical protein